MIRGGSWNNDAQNCRSAIRNNNTPDNRNENLGFRLSSLRQRSDAMRLRTHCQRQCLDHRPGPVPAHAGQTRPARRLSVERTLRTLPPGFFSSGCTEYRGGSIYSFVMEERKLRAPWR